MKLRLSSSKVQLNLLYSFLTFLLCLLNFKFLLRFHRLKLQVQLENLLTFLRLRIVCNKKKKANIDVCLTCSCLSFMILNSAFNSASRVCQLLLLLSSDISFSFSLRIFQFQKFPNSTVSKKKLGKKKGRHTSSMT